MPISIEHVHTQADAGNATTTTVTSITVEGGEILLAFVACGDATDADREDVDSLTWNSAAEAFTEVTSTLINDATNNIFTVAYILTNPSPTTASVVATWGGAVDDRAVAVLVIKGVDKVSAVNVSDNQDDANDASPAPALTPTIADTVCIAGHMMNVATARVVDNTERWDVAMTAGDFFGQSVAVPVGAATALGYTVTGGAGTEDHVSSLVALRPREHHSIGHRGRERGVRR